MQGKHCFFDQNTEVNIPAGTTLLVFSRDEIFLIRSIIDYVCEKYDVDILHFERLLEQLDQEEDMQ